MEAYAWYTINRESHDRFHNHIDEAEGRRRLQQPQVNQPLQRRLVRLALSTLLIAAGTRLQAQEQVPK